MRGSRTLDRNQRVGNRSREEILLMGGGRQIRWLFYRNGKEYEGLVCQNTKHKQTLVEFLRASSVVEALSPLV